MLIGLSALYNQYFCSRERRKRQQHPPVRRGHRKLRLQSGKGSKIRILSSYVANGANRPDEKLVRIRSTWRVSGHIMFRRSWRAARRRELLKFRSGCCSTPWRSVHFIWALCVQHVNTQPALSLSILWLIRVLVQESNPQYLVIRNKRAKNNKTKCLCFTAPPGASNARRVTHVYPRRPSATQALAGTVLMVRGWNSDVRRYVHKRILVK